MTRDHWPRLMVHGGTTATALAALFSACVTDGPEAVRCPPDLLCAPNWVCTEAAGKCHPETCGDGIHDKWNGELCDDGDAEDGDGCSGFCLFLDRCGDGIIDPGETCDDRNTVSGDGCSAECIIEVCLNSVIDGDEECDEGAETATCDSDCTPAWCGDGHPNPFFINPLTNLPEVCDDGMNTATCDADCTEPACGDGLHNPEKDEECDDGAENSVSGGCLPGCKLATCGDGYQWAGVEECGDVSGQSNGGDPVDTEECDADCTFAVCGDGHLNTVADEQCDDGNDSVNDVCPSGEGKPCQPARCGDGFLHSGVEQCDDGNTTNDAQCDSDCTQPVCGDGLLNESHLIDGRPEECDDGNRLNIDACLDGVDGHCRRATCGDGFVHLGVELCDDGNTVKTDACPSGEPGLCTPARCGDGFLRPGIEACDDGNNEMNDGCPSGTLPSDDLRVLCQVAYCGDGFILANVEDCETGVPCANQNETCDLPTCQCN